MSQDDPQDNQKIGRLVREQAAVKQQFYAVRERLDASSKFLMSLGSLIAEDRLKALRLIHTSAALDMVQIAAQLSECMDLDVRLNEIQHELRNLGV